MRYIILVIFLLIQTGCYFPFSAFLKEREQCADTATPKRAVEPFDSYCPHSNHVVAKEEDGVVFCKCLTSNSKNAAMVGLEEFQPEPI